MVTGGRDRGRADVRLWREFSQISPNQRGLSAKSRSAKPTNPPTKKGKGYRLEKLRLRVRSALNTGTPLFFPLLIFLLEGTRRRRHPLLLIPCNPVLRKVQNVTCGLEKKCNCETCLLQINLSDLQKSLSLANKLVYYKKVQNVTCGRKIKCSCLLQIMEPSSLREGRNDFVWYTLTVFAWLYWLCLVDFVIKQSLFLFG